MSLDKASNLIDDQSRKAKNESHGLVLRDGKGRERCRGRGLAWRGWTLPALQLELGDIWKRAKNQLQWSSWVPSSTVSLTEAEPLCADGFRGPRLDSRRLPPSLPLTLLGLAGGTLGERLAMLGGGGGEGCVGWPRWVQYDGCELDGQWDTPLKAQSCLQHIVPWPCKAEQGMTTPVFCRPALNSFPTSHPFCLPGSRFLPIFPVSAPEKKGALQNHLD